MYMKMCRKMSLAMSVIMVALMVKNSRAELYVAGDELGWTIPPNTSFYSDWAKSKTFQIGDQVLFNWTETSNDHNVAEVSTLAEYQNCTKPGIVFGNGLVSNLVSEGSCFFLSTVDNQCEIGMKMIVTVGSPTNTSAISSPPSHSSGLPSLTFGGLLAMSLSIAFINYV